MKRLLIAALFISPSVFAAYTEMVIEGVKQSNGVWTTAGVMDTQGFVRTTGAVSVAGTTKNLPVAFGVDAAASTGLLRVAARTAGPIALAAAAYDVYEWVVASPDIDASGNDWLGTTIDVNLALAPTGKANYTVGQYPQYGGNACNGISPCSMQKALDWLNLGSFKPFVLTSSLPVTYNSSTGLYTAPFNCTSGYQPPCAISFQYLQNPYISNDIYSKFDDLPIPSFSVLANGFNNIPSLQGQPIPVTGLSFPPFSEWASDPYFKDGNWWRDRMDISPAPTASQPTRVRIEFGPIKLEGMTDPNTPPADTPASGNTQPKEQTKFCDDNPFSIACQEMGNPEEVELSSLMKSNSSSIPTNLGALPMARVLPVLL